MHNFLSLIPILLVFLFNSTEASARSVPDHSLFTKVLKHHVKDGFVDYTALKSDKRLATYVSQIQKTDVSSLPKNERLPFWINTYNAYMLKIILEHWPVKSVMDIAGGKAWDQEWVTIKGKKYSLNQIENKIVRPMGDARIHFALVCAAKGCPPLRSEAYTASKLGGQLNDQGKAFLRVGNGQSFNVEKKQAEVSSLFKWYAGDFGKKQKDLIRFLSAFAPSHAAKSMKSEPQSWDVKYTKYDWKINGR
jgi:hypothetical protein